MKIKSKITALLTAILMLFVYVPFTAFAAETDTTDTTDTLDINAEYLSPDTLVNGKVDWNYSKQFSFDWESAGTGFQSYSWDIIDGALPPGLTLYPNGVTAQPWIEGTPTEAGTYTFTIRGCYSKLVNGQSKLIVDAVKTYTLTILPNPLKISTNILLNGNEGSPYWSKVYEGDGRTVTWSMMLADGSALPDGLSIDAASGEINWENPIVGKYNLKITAVRDEESVSKVLKLIIEPGDGCTHVGTIKTERKAATCKENGLADYWYCDTCEGYFLNAECTRSTSSDSLDNLYTIGFHSDKNNDGKCDTCGKTMPIFKKVTDENEITNCGMYLVVSKIDEKYYTFKTPEENWAESIDAVEIEQNSDGTFSYPESDSGVMILKNEFAAECGALDAGLPRYSLGTTIYGIPYCLSSDDYSGSIYMYSYETAKYGYRIKLTDDKNAEIASVYSEYWGNSESGKGGDVGILSAYQETSDEVTKRYFSFAAGGTSNPVELYKLTYAGSVSGQNYTLSDAQSVVTIDNEFTAVSSAESNECSTVSGISEAVKTNYVESVISDQTEITGGVSARTYAEISVKSEESTVNEWGQNVISSLVYTIIPKIEIKGNESEDTIVLDIDDGKFDGSGMTVTLCVGNMNPEQIIHHKTDGTKEYFYNENSENLQSGQKTFSIDFGYEKGNFVTFTIDSFSDIEILATAKAEPITVGNAVITAPISGQTPSFTAVSDDPSRYSVEVLRWIDVENNMDINPSDLNDENSPYYNYKFVSGKRYEVVVEFTAVGDYTLSYDNNFTINGEKTWWRSNGLIRTYVFVPNTDTVADKNENIFTVTGNNIDGYTVILALYKEDEQGNSRLVDCKTAVYNGESIPFTTIADDYTSAKVMVWKDLTTMVPVTEVEIVNSEQ